VSLGDGSPAEIKEIVMADVIRWDERYRSGETPWDTGQPSSELLRVLTEERLPPGRAVELGCGTGSNAVWLARQGFDVTAVDLSSLAVERARRRAEEAGVPVRFLVADVLQPPEDLVGPFDFFFDRGCYHVVRRDDVRAYLATLQRLTQPGSVGLVLAGNATEAHDPGPPVVSEEEIRAELGSLFEVLRLRAFRFDEAEGGRGSFFGVVVLAATAGGLTVTGASATRALPAPRAAFEPRPAGGR
jgi:SAM-dependent methyltransferase